MTDLRLRAYNVGFGDAILLSIPDRTESGARRHRHILFDVGNSYRGTGATNDVFEPVIDDIIAELKGRSLDLYVMTHEHMDHVQGLLFASKKLNKTIKADYAWLTGSSAPNYYETHDEAKKKLQLTRRFYDGIHRQLAAGSATDRQELAAMMFNNSNRTADCVDYLRGIAEPDRTHYVYRGYPNLDRAHPFRGTRLTIWAPEEDTSDYYGHFKPLGLGFMDGKLATGVADRTQEPLAPPRGVDAGAFYNLVERRRGGLFGNLLTIDKAANNTSVVLLIEWQGWRFLFPGDAELRSWRTIKKHNGLGHVHFLKISHHGSHNGTPSEELLDDLMPMPSPDDVDRIALLTTCRGQYRSVPDDDTVTRLSQRCTVHRTDEVQEGSYFDLVFSA